MSGYYQYSEYNDFNRVTNIDGIEGKIIEHLINSNTKNAETFWKILKYDSKDALIQANLSKQEKMELIEGYGSNPTGGQTGTTRLFLSPFSDDAWNQECSSVYMYVDDVYPIDHMRANLVVTIETVTHIKVNVLYGDADTEANPNTNPNDYYYTDLDNPTVRFKARSSVLVKCILAELNGLYLDGIGYLQFNINTAIPGLGSKVEGNAKMTVYNRRSYFGHKINFNMAISGVSSDPAKGF